MTQYARIEKAVREALEKQGVADKGNIDRVVMAVLTELTTGGGHGHR